ncbi:MAG: polyisoprenyl-teichoic acid--peptidoglycan teichoic acid transferase [Actinomycetota bacterium]|nr:polyisoprenyl-teichoic acid--peptidoglycan teichoic acid transferase [Actinomycetota bacterium]
MMRRALTGLAAIGAGIGAAMGAVLLVVLILGALFLPVAADQRPSYAAPLTIGRVHARFQPEDGKIFVLVIGNDARSGNPDRALADAIHIAGINTKTMKGGILNFPRDCWVPIPGYGSGKINEALFAGGPERVAETLENLTGIRLDYWAMVGFEGFEDLVKGVGPIKMKIPYPMYDPGGSGAHLDSGVQRMTYWKALAYARTRHGLPHGDIDRTTNQAKFLIAMLRELRSDVGRSSGALLKWMSVTRDVARLNVSPRELFRLGILATQVKPKDIGNVTVPVSLGSMGAASVDFISGSAEGIYDRFKEKASL